MYAFKPKKPKASIPKRGKLLGFLLARGVAFKDYAGKSDKELFTMARRYGFFNRSGSGIQPAQKIKRPPCTY